MNWNAKLGYCQRKKPIPGRCHKSLNKCSAAIIPKLHVSPGTRGEHPEFCDVGVALPGEIVTEVWGARLPVLEGTAPASAFSSPELGTCVLLALSTESGGPHAPVTADKSWMLLSAAGDEPQLAACAIQIESVSRSKTATKVPLVSRRAVRGRCGHTVS